MAKNEKKVIFTRYGFVDPGAKDYIDHMNLVLQFEVKELHNMTKPPIGTTISETAIQRFIDENEDVKVILK